MRYNFATMFALEMETLPAAFVNVMQANNTTDTADSFRTTSDGWNVPGRDDVSAPVPSTEGTDWGSYYSLQCRLRDQLNGKNGDRGF